MLALDEVDRLPRETVARIQRLVEHGPANSTSPSLALAFRSQTQGSTWPCRTLAPGALGHQDRDAEGGIYQKWSAATALFDHALVCSQEVVTLSLTRAFCSGVISRQTRTPL